MEQHPDTITLAKAVLASAVYWEDAGQSYSGYEKYICRHCDERVEAARYNEPQEKLAHKSDCVVLLARKYTPEHPDDCY